MTTKNYYINSNMTSEKVQNKIVKKHIHEQQSGLGQIFCKVYGQYFIKGCNGSIYHYTDNDCLWVPISREKLAKLVEDILVPCLRVYLMHLNDQLVDLLGKKFSGMKKLGQLKGVGMFKNCKTIDDIQKRAEEKGIDALKMGNYFLSLDATLKQISFLQGNQSTKKMLNNILVMLEDEDFETEKLNREAYLVPTNDGKVVCLKTGKVRDRKKEDYFSHCFDAKMTTSTEKPQQFFSQIFPNPKTRLFAKRFCGYSMSLDNAEKKVFVLIGTSDNGKSVLLKIMKAIMRSPFYKPTGKSAIAQMGKRKASQHTSDLISLKGTRCNGIVEMNNKDTFDLDGIKRIVGDDAFPIRQLNKDEENITCYSKLWVTTNSIPNLPETTGVNDKICCLPFTQTFEKTPENNRYCKSLEKDYHDEFFTYFVEGAVEHFQSGTMLPQSAEMKACFEKYSDDVHRIDAFLENSCEVDLESNKMRTHKPQMWKAYQRYIANAGCELLLTKSEFYDKLKVVLGKPIKTGGVEYFEHVEIISEY